MTFWFKQNHSKLNPDFFKILVNELNTGIICLDSAYQIFFTNKRLKSLFEIDEDYLKDKSLLDLIPVDEKKQIEYILKNIRFSGSANFTLNLFIHTELKTFECYGYFKKFNIKDMFIITINTSPKYHKNTKQLVNSQKFEILGRLTSGFAHDFNNMLAAAIGYITLIRTTEKSDEQNKDYLSKLDHVLTESASSLRKILVFTRSDLDSVRSIDLVEFIPQLLEFISKLIRPNIKIKFDLPSEKSIISSNPVKLEQVIINLLLNARDAIEGPGRISILLNHKEITRINNSYSPALKKGKYYFIRIKDTGKGINDKIQEKIFEPYFSTKKDTGGSGLGLFIVHETLDNLGGGIKINSQEGQGTECIVAVPAATSSVEEKMEPTKSSHTHSGKLNILLIEDETEVSEILQGMLEKMNVKTRIANTAKKSLKYLEKNSPDLVIMDFGLPDMSGKELFRTINKKYKKLPVIITTGYTKQELLLAIPNFNPDLILSKPFHFEKLQEKIKIGLSH